MAKEESGIEGLEEFEDVFGISAEEQALLDKMEEGEPRVRVEPEPTPTPTPEPTPEPTPAVPPVVEPTAAEPPPVAEPPPGFEPPPISTQEPPAAPPAPIERFELPADREPTLGELGQFVQQMALDQTASSEHARGLRDDLIRERERRRVAEYMQQVAPPAPPVLDPDAPPGTPPQPTPEVAAEAARRGIPIVLGEDGNYEVDPARMEEFLAQRGTGAPPGEPPPAGADPRNQAFDTLRSALIAEAPDPASTQSAVDELRDALMWMDRAMTTEGPRVQNQVRMGRGFETVHDILDKSGVGKQFSDAYHGLDPMDLVEVGITLEPFKAKRLVQKYMALKANRAAAPPPAVAPGAPPAPAVPPPGSLDQNRPPPMGGRGNVEAPVPNLAKYAAMSSTDVLELSNEEYKEMERLAVTD